MNSLTLLPVLIQLVASIAIYSVAISSAIGYCRARRSGLALEAQAIELA